jgi:hypothetical protein
MINLREAKILVEHKLNYNKIKKANELNAVASFYKWQTQLGKEPYKKSFGPHPGRQLAIQQSAIAIDEHYHSGKKFTKIGFGDSILKLTQHKITAVDPLLNFALSGSGSPDMQAIAEALYPVLENFGYTQPDAVVLGTLGGNPLLSYQDYEYVCAEATIAFKKIRELFPYAKIILYGIPPVYDVYATHYAAEFNGFLMSLVTGDSNSCYVDLYFRFAGPLRIFPEMKMFPTSENSMDGVHLTGKAIIEFNDCLERAAVPGVFLV